MEQQQQLSKSKKARPVERQACDRNTPTAALYLIVANTVLRLPPPLPFRRLPLISLGSAEPVIGLVEGIRLASQD